MLALAYSGRLRISEIVNMKIAEINSKRMVIILRQAKGKKDRQVMLSEKILQMLRAYYLKYKPNIWLFEGQIGGEYTARSIQLTMKELKNKAGIRKKGNIHALRYNFSKHLLEGGTDQFSIKDLLGHCSIKPPLPIPT